MKILNIRKAFRNNVLYNKILEDDYYLVIINVIWNLYTDKIIIIDRGQIDVKESDVLDVIALIKMCLESTLKVDDLADDNDYCNAFIDLVQDLEKSCLYY